MNDIKTIYNNIHEVRCKDCGCSSSGDFSTPLFILDWSRPLTCEALISGHEGTVSHHFLVSTNYNGDGNIIWSFSPLNSDAEEAGIQVRFDGTAEQYVVAPETRAVVGVPAHLTGNYVATLTALAVKDGFDMENPDPTKIIAITDCKFLILPENQ